MSFEGFKRAKSNEQKKGCTYRSNKKAKKNDEDETEVVTINLGIKQVDKNDLKTIRGKRLPITVPRKATYVNILAKGVEKWSAFDRRFDSSKNYVVLYEDGTLAQFMPGQTKEFFSLEKYKVEVGKDFKRIIFYLCEENQFNKYEILQDKNTDDEDDDQILADALLAQQMENEWNDGLDDPSLSAPLPSTSRKFSSTSTSTVRSSNTFKASNTCTSTSSSFSGSTSSTSTITSSPNDYKDVVKLLASKVNHADQFFLVVRRATSFERILSLWRRQSLKSNPMSVVRVHYSGEDGIDSGALALEFFEHAIDEMGKIMFPNGSPIDSSFHVQNGNFRTCGEIAAASVAQGGPAPCFLAACTYKAAYQDIDMMSISSEHLTNTEIALIEDVKVDCSKYTDLILEHNYTGIVDQKHIEEIVASLKVSFVTRRKNYMKEFMIGLNCYDLDGLIVSHPDACKSLFINGNLDHLVPDADYLFSIMSPLYAKEGSSKRLVEEQLMDHLQDTLNAFEDEHLTGSEAAVAWNDSKVDDEEDNLKDDVEHLSQDEVFESSSITIPKVMGWLTGLQHKPLSGEKLRVTIEFDHECLERNPKHRMCFPQVSACGRRVTLPVAHMKSSKEFKEIFIIAFSKGQSFAKP